MSKQLATAFAALLVLSLAGPAHAISAKWCFRWQASYEDAGKGEDYLNDPSNPNEIAAKYARVYIQKWGGEELWNGWMDSTGCTGNVEVLPGTKYRFFQYLYLKRSTRYIQVHPDGEPWNGTTEYYYSELTTPSPMHRSLSVIAPPPMGRSRR